MNTPNKSCSIKAMSVFIKRTVKILSLILLIIGVEFPVASQVRTFGSNEAGQLGTGNVFDQHVLPFTISSLTDVVDIHGGTFFTLAVRSNGTVMGWGASGFGNLGPGNYEFGRVLSPIPIAGLNDIVSVSGGYGHSLALKSDGTVWAFGVNDKGELGNGSISPNIGCGCIPIPSQVINLSNIIAISAGYYHGLALDSQGRVWAWGYSPYGEIGNGTSGEDNIVPTPTQVISLGTDVIAVAAGYNYSMALKRDGTVWVWGANSHGQVGNGTVTDMVLQPTQSSITGISQIAAGEFHLVALKPDGTVWTWGGNDVGQLGNGITTLEGRYCSPLPTQAIISDITDIRAEKSNHTLARKTDGSIWGWGNNGNGQLGNGIATPSPWAVPTPVQSNAGTGNTIFGNGYAHSLLSNPQFFTQRGSNKQIRIGTIGTVTFARILSPGMTTIASVNSTQTGFQVPVGYTILNNSAGYNIASRAKKLGAIEVCLNVPNVFDPIKFQKMRLLHEENGVLVDRFSSSNYQRREVCGRVNFLSTVVVAQTSQSSQKDF